MFLNHSLPKKKTTTLRPYKHKYYTRSRKPPNTKLKSKLKSKLKRKGTKV